MAAESIQAVLLGAGASARMGREKLLMAVDGRTVLEVSLDNHLRSSLGCVCVVVPGWIPGFGEIAARAAGRRAVFIETEKPCEMSKSLRIGWSWVRDNTESRGIMISLADQPLVATETIDLLVKAYLASDRGFCVPTYSGRRGNPVIIGREFDRDVMELRGDRGARDLIARNPELVLEVEVGSDEVLVDLDRIEDLDVIRSRMESDG
jgi:molybdenum cofactor cytidylyltransferase